MMDVLKQSSSQIKLLESSLVLKSLGVDEDALSHLKLSQIHSNRVNNFFFSLHAFYCQMFNLVIYFSYSVRSSENFCNHFLSYQDRSYKCIQTALQPNIKLDYGNVMKISSLLSYVSLMSVFK